MYILTCYAVLLWTTEHLLGCHLFSTCSCIFLILYFFSFSINLCVSTIRFWYPLTLKKSNKNKLFYPLFADFTLFSYCPNTHAHTPYNCVKIHICEMSTGCWIVSYVSVTEQRKIEMVQFITHRSYRKYMAPPKGPHWEDKAGYRQRSADKI